MSSGNRLYYLHASTSQIQEPNNTAEKPKELESFSIIVLPDTQHYSQYYPEILINQTQWIVDETSDLNLVFASSVGDLVQNGNSISEWENVAKSMKVLDDNGVSWEVLPGNHDFEDDGNLSNYNKYFGLGNFSGRSWFGGSYPNGTNNNNFVLFSAGGYDYLFLSLQHSPSDSVLAWANETLTQYPNRKVILATHGYLNLDGERRKEGDHIWNGFVSPNADQVFLVLCGHMHGEARRVDYVNGYPVHQLVADYQDRPKGGNGWLRILEFYPAEEKIFVRTYSPLLQSNETDIDSQFWLDFEMINSKSPILPSLPYQSPEPTYSPRICPLPVPESSPQAIEAESAEQLLMLLVLSAGITFFVVGLAFYMIDGFGRIE